MVVAKKWGAAHPNETKTINSVIDEAVAWFYDPKNREEAISLMTEASKSNRQEVADSYDFLFKIEFFAKTSQIQRRALNGWMKEMVAVKDMTSVIPVETLLVPGLNEIVD